MQLRTNNTARRGGGLCGVSSRLGNQKRTFTLIHRLRALSLLL